MPGSEREGLTGHPHPTIQISGFTIARRAVEFGYPLGESLRSMLPLVDELIVNVGDCEDGTWELVQGLDDPKIQAFRSTWDMSKRDGLTLSEETNKAMDRCQGAWGVYLQADEVLHEADVPLLRRAINRCHDSQVEALSLLFYHFYGSYRTYKDDPRHWYRRATRVVRLGMGIESVGDACAFEVREGSRTRPPRRRNLRTHVFHYGRVRPPQQMLEKQRHFERFYHDEEWSAAHGIPEGVDPDLAYADRRDLRAFRGTHPAVMHERIAAETSLQTVLPKGRWSQWLRRAYVYGAWMTARAKARLLKRT